MIQVTDKAAERITEIQTHWKAGFVRLAVKGGGCSGFMYDFSVTNEVDEDDLEINGLILDPITAMMLDEATLDLKSDLLEEKFVVVNPKATHKCGCGESFTA